MLRYSVMLINSRLITHCKTTLRWLLRRGSPLPIPNREVKPACADGTAICGRVCRRLSFENPVSYETGFFVLYYFRRLKLWAMEPYSFIWIGFFGFIL